MKKVTFTLEVEMEFEEDELNNILEDIGVESVEEITGMDEFDYFQEESKRTITSIKAAIE